MYTTLESLKFLSLCVVANFHFIYFIQIIDKSNIYSIKKIALKRVKNHFSIFLCLLQKDF